MLWCNQRSIGGQIDLRSVLCQAVKQLAARGRCAPIESERELIKIIVEVVLAYGFLVRSHQPALKQGHDSVNARQQMHIFWLGALNLPNHGYSPVG